MISTVVMLCFVQFAGGQTVSVNPRTTLIEQIRAKVAEQARELDAANAKARAAIAAAERQETELQAAQAQINQVAGERDNWQDYANDQARRWLDAEKRHAAVAKKYHRLKWAACLLLSGIAAAALWKFKSLLIFIPPPYNLVAIVAAPAALFGLLWILL